MFDESGTALVFSGKVLVVSPYKIRLRSTASVRSHGAIHLFFDSPTIRFSKKRNPWKKVGMEFRFPWNIRWEERDWNRLRAKHCFYYHLRNPNEKRKGFLFAFFLFFFFNFSLRRYHQRNPNVTLQLSPVLNRIISGNDLERGMLF